MTAISLLEPGKRVLHYAGRPESASPAAGTTKRHEQEQADLVSDAFAPTPRDSQTEARSHRRQARREEVNSP